MNDDPPWWDPRVKNRSLKEGATYESDNSDSGGNPPFQRFVFLTLKSWTDRDGDHNARVLILQSEDHKLYPAGSVQEINPAYWLWTASKRIV